MDKKTLDEITKLKKRVSRLEQVNGITCRPPEQKTLELDITLPSADIGGLRFNETKVSAVFDLKEDGWYHSRDILFVSARNTENDNSRDILTEYLTWHDGGGIRILSAQIAKHFDVNHKAIEVSLPEQNEGNKTYGGIIAPYWQRYTIGDEHFLSITSTGSSVRFRSDELSGVAPMFRIKEAV